ncbi:excinuclease ABC subunit UvrA [Actinacidiphila acidipaludis]|uniref:UvrABC system protein A n=1 Tax=Actinacidiphila acidipaludis TaxID=2873382 RepID=A0ABS7QJ41_9ACTN|nr:excinuclease ABC subunit UvrA [Streptomyces acidipaludis]MBY8881789.1 excinuclease ABC subunit UvrA [Streptomyces acidipaludis]
MSEPPGAAGRPPAEPAPAPEAADPFVRVRGAREHNLRRVDLDIPRNTLAVFTGVSGSGKSSLAFGTLYAEAQRRYFESVAPYARRLIHQIGAPKVDGITGLPPAVALQQRRGTPGSRSTVGTVTTLSNLLRMLYSRAGDYPPGTAERLDSDAFSANTAVGACPECHGLGRVHRVTEASLVPDPSLSIRDHAIAAWPGAWQGKNFRDVVQALGYDIDRPWRELPQADRDFILFSDEQPVVTVHPVREAGRIQRPYQGTFSSARRYVLRAFSESKSAATRRRVLRHLESATCPVCEGRRLRPEALAVTFAGHGIADLTRRPLADLPGILAPAARTGGAGDGSGAGSGDAGGGGREGTDEAAAALVEDLVARIEVLVGLGLGYLSMDRTAPTLSPGELQRLRLATQLRAGLFGVVYVLDEPSAGLHPADTEPLLDVLDRLRAEGNSLFVVEHDLDVVRRAGWVVDVGPGAGRYGGQVLYSGPVPGLRQAAESATGKYLFGEDSRPRPPRTPREPAGWLRLRGVTRHNLRDLAVDLPLGVVTAVTGVSGSGKSTLVDEVARAVAAGLHPDPDSDSGAVTEAADGMEAEEPDEAAEFGDERTPGPAAAIDVEGLDAVDRLVRVDQKPIGRTPRSNLATYTGLFDAVRTAFAATPEARARRYTPGRFSFNVAAGRCPTCQGEGFVAVELLFLPGTYAPCPTCHGARYNPETLQITYRDRTIADVLAMSVDEAAGFFADLPAAARSLTTLQDVGLGYLSLGQPATELSGGEAQRIKLAAELQRARRGRTLYLLDEPTTGLHPADVTLLMSQVQGLADAGNSVVLVEHDMSVVAAADWVLDLGPGAGDAGGRVVAAGPPLTLVRDPVGRTAPYLARHLGDAALPGGTRHPTGDSADLGGGSGGG